MKILLTLTAEPCKAGHDKLLELQQQQNTAATTSEYERIAEKIMNLQQEIQTMEVLYTYVCVFTI